MENLTFTYKDLVKRNISKSTAEKFGYGFGEYEGKPVHVASFYDDQSNVVAYKLRFPDKSFKWIGDSKSTLLFGQQLWKTGGKRLVITEGEIDCLSISQIQNNKWPVVSIKNGAQGAHKDCAKQIEWIESFDEVIFCFDNDEAGRKAAQSCANLLSPGKAMIAQLPVKDANQMLCEQKTEELLNCLWQAKAYRPDGIINAQDAWSIIENEENTYTLPYPWESMNTMTHGLRVGELVTITAGTGIGKSQLCRQIAYDLIQKGETIGYIALEENIKRTLLGFLSLSLKQPLHLLDSLGDVDGLKYQFDKLFSNRNVYFYDHFGSLDTDNLFSKIRYLAKGCHCKWIFLDHISIVVSGLSGGDERRLIDNAVTKLRSLVEELDIGLILVSHLKRTDGQAHEDGGQTSLSHLRGSNSIAQLSDMVIGLERNQQDTENKNTTKVRVLKNRFSGETGICSLLEFNTEDWSLNERKPIDKYI